MIAKLTAAGFMINIKKCDFLCKEVQMLGFMIGNGKVRPVARQLDVIAEWKVPSVSAGCSITLWHSFLFSILYTKFRTKSSMYFHCCYGKVPS